MHLVSFLLISLLEFLSLYFLALKGYLLVYQGCFLGLEFFFQLIQFLVVLLEFFEEFLVTLKYLMHHADVGQQVLDAFGAEDDIHHAGIAVFVHGR